MPRKKPLGQRTPQKLPASATLTGEKVQDLARRMQTVDDRLINVGRIAIALGDNDLSDLVYILVSPEYRVEDTPEIAKPGFTIPDATFVSLWMEILASVTFPQMCLAIHNQPEDQRNRLMSVVSRAFLLMGKYPGWTQREYGMFQTGLEPTHSETAVLAYDEYKQECDRLRMSRLYWALI